MEKTLKVLKIDQRGAYTGENENELQALQSFVSGYIEVVPLTKQLAVICNEEGHMQELPKTVWLSKRGSLSPVGVLRGPLLVCRMTGDGEFTDIDLKQDLGEVFLHIHPVQ